MKVPLCAGLITLILLHFFQQSSGSETVRLANRRVERGEIRGRVEVRNDWGQWNSICDRSWEDEDADVVCRQLGYASGRKLDEYRGHSSYLFRRFLRVDVECVGSESRIQYCQRFQSGYSSYSSCSYGSEEAHVACARTLPTTPPPSFSGSVRVRLAGGSSRYEGRVEINYENQWGTVCDDSWNSRDAAVVCRQLGYSNGKSRGSAYFGRGSGPIWMDEVNCGGSESSLDQCRHNGWGNHDCSHGEDAGVVCQSVTQPIITQPSCSSRFRVRKDFMSMSSTEKRRYIDAVILASTDSRYKRDYDNLLHIHRDNFGNMIHQREEFLPWHRWFLLQYENLLCRVDSRVTLPFWDWRGDRPLSTSSPSMWHHNYFGGNGQPCVANGPFRRSQWSLPDGSCLRRNFDHTAIFPDYAAVAHLLRENDLNEFERILRVQMHNNVHCHVGGTMCSSSAGYAPEFFLHHAFIDKLWDDWQSKSVRRKTTFVGNIDSPMTAASGATPRQFLDSRRLPGGVSVSYTENSIERALSRQSTSMLQYLVCPNDVSVI